MLRAEDKSAEAPKSPIINSGHTYEEQNTLPGHSQAAWPPQNPKDKRTRTHAFSQKNMARFFTALKESGLPFGQITCDRDGLIRIFAEGTPAGSDDHSEREEQFAQLDMVLGGC